MERSANKNVKVLVEGAMMIAIATILSFVKVAEMPYGGSVTAASMVPILIYAYRWGAGRGILVGVVYGLIQFMIDPYAAHPISVVMDYPLAFGVLGVMGLFAHKSSNVAKIITGIVVAIGLRFVSHYLSGVIFFGMYAPENMSPYWYSLVYNGAYLLPEMIISIIFFMLLHKQLKNLKM